MAASWRSFFLFALWLLAATSDADGQSPAGHNITAVLDGFPEYSVYNGYLTQTRVCDEINGRETVTCLVLPNAAMSALAGNLSIAAVKNALRLLTLLDYFDAQKLHSLSSGSTLTTTLYQATGDAAGDLGHVNITDLRGGKVGFASAAKGAAFDALYTKSVKAVPYTLSVLEISAPITFPGLLDAPTASSANLTALLEKAGCKKFAALVESSGVLKIYEGVMSKGLTVLAPNDDAFDAPGAPDLGKLTSAELVTVLQYHALPEYEPKDTLKSTDGPVQTLASSGSGKYDLSVVSHGDDVSLNTGVGTSRVASTVLDDAPVCVLTVDNLLLPSEIFGGAPSPAPALAPTPEEATAPTPDVAEAPTPTPGKKKKGKGVKAPAHSPPAPPASAPSTDDAADAPDTATLADKVVKNGAAKKAAVAGGAWLVFFLAGTVAAAS